jgi:nitrite reductase/ring-hydroxylating ferredoxin subunit
MDTRVSRRTVLVVAAAGTTAAVVAACTSGGTGSAVHSTASLPKLADIPVGQAVSATIDGKPAIIARPSDSTVTAFSAICTHQHCTVAPAGTELHCPCHGSVYQATTGEVIHGPAPRALDKIAVHLVNGQVVAGS